MKAYDFTGWQSITSADDPQFLVKGTDLSQCIYGPLSRFAVVEVRTYGADGFADRRHSVRDAHTITDAQRKAGHKPRAIASFETSDEAFAAIDRYWAAHPEELPSTEETDK